MSPVARSSCCMILSIIVCAESTMRWVVSHVLAVRGRSATAPSPVPAIKTLAAAEPPVKPASYCCRLVLALASHYPGARRVSNNFEHGLSTTISRKNLLSIIYEYPNIWRKLDKYVGHYWRLFTTLLTGDDFLLSPCSRRPRYCVLCRPRSAASDCVIAQIGCEQKGNCLPIQSFVTFDGSFTSYRKH